MRRTWLLDFDDTLASGVVTWGLEYAVPKMAETLGLPVDAERFARASVTAIEQSNQTTDLQRVMDQFLRTMRWALTPEQKRRLFADVQSGYQPALFPDTLPFLERLREGRQHVFVLSNNPRALDFCRLLGLEAFFEGIFTPHLFADCPPKPHRALLDRVMEQHPSLDLTAACVVGDDPWSDGAFAEACGLPCWIVDRKQRFTALRHQRPYRWVSALNEIA